MQRQKSAGLPEIDHPGDAQINHAQGAKGKTHQADGAEQVLWPLAEPGEKFDREQIEKSFDKAAHPILGVPESARAVIDFDFADRVAAGRRQDRDEAVQLAI